jgi:hypothetical protein
MGRQEMGRLLSENVGLPHDISWRGETVRTSVWKNPVQDRLSQVKMPSSLNIFETSDIQDDETVAWPGRHDATFR